MGPFTLILMQAWVYRRRWYEYAEQNRSLVPHDLVDRSCCQDPFLDQFGTAGERRAVVSGLCRGFKHFSAGQRILYITRVDPALHDHKLLGGKAGCYLPVAALEVQRVYRSHEEAAGHFAPRQYVQGPSPTPFPPNLAHLPHPEAAASRLSSVVHAREQAKVYSVVGEAASEAAWMAHYMSYHRRANRKQLHAAECRILTNANHTECLHPMADQAPALTLADMGITTKEAFGRGVVSVSKTQFEALLNSCF